MKAAVLEAFGRPLEIRDVPDPSIGTGEVIVDVTATAVLPYAAEFLSGERRYGLPTPVVPGCGAIGRVHQVGPDATRLEPGDWVFCDPTVRSRDDALQPDIALQGLSARGSGGERLQRYFRDGPLAERMRVPTENAIPIGDITATEAVRWSALGVLLVGYGGLRAARFQPGETLLVSGATGHFGGAAVATALAMGARRVIAPGRNAQALADLARRFGARVVPVHLTGDDAHDEAAISAAAPAPIDVVLDLLPPSAPASVARARIMAVRQNGRVALMGGVGMLGGDDLALPYPWIMRNNITIHGQWMYPREAIPGLIGLVRCGLLDLGQFETAAFALDDANAAVAHAAAHGAAFQQTVVTP